jgi:ribosome-associated toxin RatA of RatAB toxin-antitoxin module
MQQAMFIILGALAVFVLGMFIISLFLPSRVRVERSLLIRAPAARIFMLVNALRNWPQWSPWHSKDPQMKVEFSEKDAGKGAWYKWKSHRRKVGKGRLVITESRVNEYIANEMHFMQKRASRSYFRFEPSAEGTRVTWCMEAEMGRNLMRRYMGKKVNKWVGSDFEKGLHNLKRVCEKIHGKEREAVV